MPSNRDGGPPSAQPPEPQHPKLTVAGRNADGTLKLRVQVPGLLHRFTLSRGPDERPLQFDGEVLAEVETPAGGAGGVLRAAIYRTKSGQHVAEFSRQTEGSERAGKAAVFETLDEAVAWFRPGKLTVLLLKQLGRWQPESLDEIASAGENDMPTTTELESLLLYPNESLTVEHKSWLDLGDTGGRARLAKAAIALANHGGGTVVFGMRHEDGNGPLQSVPLPEEIDTYTQDDVNQAINRFADPEFHCELLFAEHPGTKVKHAFVIVPGSTVPVMSRREYEGVIAARKCYMRKPGPRSEEPLTAEEWRTLINRCVRSGREDMLNSIRAILHGSAGGAVRTAPGDGLTNFISVARDRWSQLTALFPADDAARFPLGHYELGFEILAAKPMANLAELRRAMQEAGTLRHTGWGPFVQLHRPELEPRVVAGAIEAWAGATPTEKLVLERVPAHCDFWRADTSGRLILFRGYDEDGVSQRVEPGKGFDITLPVWRVGEAILYVGRLADSFGDNLSFLVRCRYVGLRGRRLVNIEGRRMLFDDRVAADEEVVLERQITRAQARDNLVEVLHALLSPLYERFGFFELSERLVAEEVARLTSGRF